MLISLLHEQLLSGIRLIPGVETASETPRRRDQITLPAVLVDLVELEPSTDPGTGELALISHWEGRVLVPEKSEERISWCLVQAVMVWLYNHSFPEINIGKAMIKQAAHDHFTPDISGHRIWLIEWTHDIRIGDDDWQDGPTINPQTIVIHCGDNIQELDLTDV